MAKSRYQKQSGGGIVKAVVAVLVAGILAAGVCCVGYASRNDAGQWFGNSDLSTWHWGNKPPVSDVGDDLGTITASGEGGMQISPSKSSGLMAVAVASAEGEPAVQAESSYTLTATVEPEDATNKVVDWSVSWENGSSSWANGKSVTNYVTITPTSDGALTARADCLQAFGEKITIRAQVRDSEDVFATCEVNYVQKYVGANFHLQCALDFVNKNKYIWDFSYGNLNPVVDFPASTNQQVWATAMGNEALNSSEVTHELSGTYTKGYTASIAEEWTVAVTEDYLSALRAAGLTPQIKAEEYRGVKSVNDMLMYGVCGGYPASTSAWSGFRTALRNNSDKVMIRVSCIRATLLSRDVTRYNIKFSASSLQTIATDVGLDKPSIDF